MKVSKLTAFLGLIGLTDNTRFNVTGFSSIGSKSEKVDLPTSDIIYALRFVMFSGAAVLNLSAGTTALSTAFVPGSQKIVSITCAGSANAAAGSYVIPITVVATGMVTQVINVSVKAGESVGVWSAKARAALASNAAIATFFTVGGIGNDITLSQLPIFDDNDGFRAWATPIAAITIAVAAGTALVTVSNSTVTAAGAITSGVRVFGGDGKDHEGVLLPNLLTLTGFDCKSKVVGHVCAITSTATTIPVKSISKSGRITEAFLDGAAIGVGSVLTFTASAAGLSDIQIGISGKST